MKALVTGGAGFIGSHLVEALVKQGWRVTVIDDGSSNAVPPESLPASIIEGTVAETLLPSDVDAIFHLAGPVGPVGVLGHAGEIVASIVADAHRLGQQAAWIGCPLVFVSTSEVYVTATPQGFAEGEEKISPRTEYGIGKLAAEVMLRDTPSLDVRIVRPFNVAGPRQRADGGFVLPRFIAQAQHDEPLTVYVPGTQQRSLTHVNDIVTGILAVHSDGKPGRVYNLGHPGNVTTMLNLAELVREVVGSASEIRLVNPNELHGSAFAEVPDKVAYIERARTELGWEPRHSLYDIVRDAVDASW